VLRESFGWNTRYVLITDKQGWLIGALPFVSKRRFLVKSVNVCLPLTDVVGPLWRDSAVASETLDIADCLSSLEIHSDIDSEHFSRLPLYHRCVLDMSSFESSEDLLMSFKTSSIRQRIKRADREGVEVRASGERAGYDEFARMVAMTRRWHGAPSYPANFFSTIREQMQSEGLARLYLGYLNGHCVAGQMVFPFGDTAIMSYSASIPDKRVRQSGVNQAIKWMAIRQEFCEGRRYIDFGVANVEQPSLREYKESWGASSVVLNYAFAPKNQSTLRVGQESRLGRVVKRIMSKLPLAIYRQYTPLLQKMAA
jgi:lipid II:glycine glycyltransferase (peptidoglycan interpeptide bridge formation enzyme)